MRVKEVDNDVMRVVELLVEVLDVEVLLVLGDDVLVEGVIRCSSYSCLAWR